MRNPKKGEAATLEYAYHERCLKRSDRPTVVPLRRSDHTTGAPLGRRAALRCSAAELAYEHLQVSGQTV